MIKLDSILKFEIYNFLDIRKFTKSESTYRHDKKYLIDFDNYLCSIYCDNKNLTEKQITDWVKTLKGKTSSIANIIIVIRIFLKQLTSYGIYSYIPTIPKVHDDYIPYIFSDIEVSKIFSSADNLVKSNYVQENIFIHLEMPMLLRLMYGCGLRTGEALALKYENIDLELGVLNLEKTKGNKQRIVPMHHSLTKILQKYCIAMGIIGKPNKLLFPRKDKMVAIKPSDAKNKFHEMLNGMNIILSARKKYERGPCLHCLRHVFVFKSFANCERNGNKIDDVVPHLSFYLGHESLKETDKYFKFSNEVFPKELKLFEEYTLDIFPEVNYGE